MKACCVDSSDIMFRSLLIEQCPFFVSTKHRTDDLIDHLIDHPFTVLKKQEKGK